nr:hypothetical protein HK105_005219 [Polyrhizophydium stewartii]
MWSDDEYTTASDSDGAAAAGPDGAVLLLPEEHENAAFNDDGFPTATSETQLEVEDSVRHMLHLARPHPSLMRRSHVSFIESGLRGLSRWWVSLDASRPWLVMWMLHSLDLLGHEISDTIKSRAVSTLSHCQCETGGFAGGPGQLAHLATTFAAVNALAIVGTREAFESIDRPAMYEFIMSLKQPDGSFVMHEDGEADSRAVYCAINTAYLLNILTPELVDRVGEYIVRCQSYDGGLSGVPGTEAHGGLAFCAAAAMYILGKMDMLDTDALASWAVNRQMAFEGGFQGRPNKLVDGCYSFWHGAIISMLEEHLSAKKGRRVLLFNHKPLQTYILTCCQGLRGGLLDKPDK